MCYFFGWALGLVYQGKSKPWWIPLGCNEWFKPFSGFLAGKARASPFCPLQMQLMAVLMYFFFCRAVVLVFHVERQPWWTSLG